jgi:hypothetical protein
VSDPQVYTVEEANALLPFLAPALVELREKWEQADLAQKERTRAAMANGGRRHLSDGSEVLERVAELMERLNGWGVHLRDVDTGLVDFPSRIEGEDAFLCWRLGEPEVAHWHPAGEGFGGRRDLP